MKNGQLKSFPARVLYSCN